MGQETGDTGRAGAVNDSAVREPHLGHDQFCGNLHEPGMCSTSGLVPKCMG
jgi:hypothetical protein